MTLPLYIIRQLQLQLTTSTYLYRIICTTSTTITRVLLYYLASRANLELSLQQHHHVATLLLFLEENVFLIVVSACYGFGYS